MFCRECGYELSDNAKFCIRCGTTVDSPPPAKRPQPPVQPAPSAAPSKKLNGKQIGGIALMVMGALSILGSFASDYYYNIMNNGMNSSDYTTIAVQIGMLLGGAALYFKK
ncbi:MAG: zinc ribbon domain-containing protein [Clostridia bacterium]|nr:zinc ribbon domain-containing protein [Clostridia bacterium]